MQKNNKFQILQSFDKNHKIVVSHRYDENADKNGKILLICWQKKKKLYRHFLRKQYIYKLPGSIANYNPTIYDFYLQKKITNADFFQTDDVIILFKGTFGKIKDLLILPPGISNNNKKTPIWIEQLELLQQTFVEFSLANYRKKVTADFIEESYFLYDKSNLIK